ncbi:unnamed protein product [Arabidopsis thaliana]|uniref:(thale cress) hypothetical protein n=1 Tax=Arabidopsis thaliana TaxID=3702 RepID=A0A7G2E9H9_ARATH|nr:unnamed protein product [Arabidopsis thaliana]
MMVSKSYAFLIDKAVMIPTASFSMYLYLPDKKGGLDNLLERVTSTSGFFDSHIQKYRVDVGDFRYPKFKIEFGFEASSVFNDFELNVSLHHKALIEIDEEVTGPFLENFYDLNAIFIHIVSLAFNNYCRARAPPTNTVDLPVIVTILEINPTIYSNMKVSRLKLCTIRLSETSRARSIMDSSDNPDTNDVNKQGEEDIAKTPSSEKSGGKRKKDSEFDDENENKKAFSCPTKQGTSNLTKHLGTCKQYKAWAGRSTQNVISQEGKLKDGKVTEKVFREASNELLVLAELPLAFIECMAWKRFCEKCNLYKPHLRRTSTRDIVEMYLARKAALKEWVLLECLADWSIEKLCTIRVDNATANTSALKKFQAEFNHQKWRAVCELAFQKMEDEDKLYNDYFMEFDDGQKRIGPPTYGDWRAIERLVKFLGLFYTSTLVVSASTNISSYKCYGEIVTIEKNLITLSRSYDKELGKMATEMREKFTKYWDGVKNINKMLIVASVFDPRKKMQFAKMCFEKLYGKDSDDAKDMSIAVYDVMKDMLKEYSGRYGASSIQSSQSQTSSSSTAQVRSIPSECATEDHTHIVEFERMDNSYDEMVKENGVVDSKDELDIYLKDEVENPKTLLGTEWDVLSWWRLNCHKFLVLSEIAKDVLAMQVSSVASESAFITSGRIIPPHRSCLTHYMVEVLMCTEQWIKQDIKISETISVTNAQLLADIEYLDKLEKEVQNGVNQS